MYGIRLHIGIPFESSIVTGIEINETSQKISTNDVSGEIAKFPGIIASGIPHIPIAPKTNGNANENRIIVPAILVNKLGSDVFSIS